MPHSVSHPGEGIDTALARVLHEQGLVDLPTLQASLKEARARRADDPNTSLAGLLKHRQVVSEEALEHSLGLLRALGDAPTGTTPTTIGPYDVVREVARGGMGVVYQVLDPGTGTHYALKTLLLTSHPSLFDEERARFLREAEVLARLRHPHIVQVHAADLDGTTPYLVQDYLPGGTLQERLREGPLPIEEAIALTETLAGALEHAHQQGVLHRDLKPLNVLFDDRGAPRLVDFGLALRLAEQQRLTQTGAALGTPGFLAPEQARGEHDVDARTDVYGLAATLYALLVGHPPFTGQGLGGLAEVAHDLAPALRRGRPDAPAWLEAVVAKALAKRPQDRFPSAAAFAAALRAEETVVVPKQRRSASSLALLATLLVAVPLGGLAWHHRAATPIDLNRLQSTIRRTARSASSLQDLEPHLEAWRGQIDRTTDASEEQRGPALGQLAVLRGLVALSADDLTQACEQLELAERADPSSYLISGLRGGIALVHSSRLTPREALGLLSRAVSDSGAWELVSWRARARLRAGLTTSADQDALESDLNRLDPLPAARTEVHRRLRVELALARRRSDDAELALARLVQPAPTLTWRLGLLRAREALVNGSESAQALTSLPQHGSAPLCPEATALAGKLDGLILASVPAGAGDPGAPPATLKQCRPLFPLLALRARLPRVPVAAKTRAALHGIAGNYMRTENNLPTVRLGAVIGDLFPTDSELQVRLAAVSVRGTSSELLFPAAVRALALTTHPVERFRLRVIIAWLKATKLKDRDQIRAGAEDCRRLRAVLPSTTALRTPTPFSTHLRLIDPILPRLWGSEAEALHHLGEHKASLRCHEVVVKLDRGSEGQRSHAAQVRELRELNQHEDAVRAAQLFFTRRGLELGPPSEVVLDQLWHVPTDAARRVLSTGLWIYLPKTDKFRNWWIRLAWLEHEAWNTGKAAQALRQAAAAFRRGKREQPHYAEFAARATTLAGRLEQGGQREELVKQLRALLRLAFKKP